MDGALQIEIEDNGRGLPREMREGLGLSNTRARLEQMYGGAHRFELQAANGDGSGTLVRLLLPLQSENRATREAR
jgi:signal transduction histidine kinase